MNFKKYILLLLLLVIPFLFTSCFDVDNYDAPNAGIYGTLIDTELNTPVYTEQPDGCRIELLDLSYENPTPLRFWAKADGTFRNVALFGGEYKVTPTEGPFFPVETETVKLNGVTQHDFKVVPYLQLEIVDILKGSEGSAEVSVKYKVKRSTPPAGITLEQKTIAEVWILCNTAPVVSYSNSGYKENISYKKEFSRTSDTNIEKTVYEDKIPNLVTGQKYYMRLSGRSTTASNTLKRMNYTQTVEFTAP